MRLSINNRQVDGFRFINNLNTTSRQLAVCSEIVKQLGVKQLPKELLSKLLCDWSTKLETDEDYKNSKGKVTQDGKETSALKYYIDLADFLGLITHINNFYTNTRLAYILLYLINTDKEPIKFGKLTDTQKIFYLFQLFRIDGDGIIFLLNTFKKDPIGQLKLQQIFKEEFNDRLLLKKDLATDIVKRQISEKYRAINFIWKKPEKYSEHLLIPRCEWLKSLGLVEISKRGNNTIYSLSPEGSLLFDKLPVCNEAGSLRDIDESWIHNDFFEVVNEIYFDSKKIRIDKLDKSNVENTIGTAIEKAVTVVKTSSSFRIPIFDTIFFICIELMINNNIVVCFSDIFELFKNGFSYNGKEYFLRDTGRINEGYITTRLIE